MNCTGPPVKQRCPVRGKGRNQHFLSLLSRSDAVKKVEGVRVWNLNAAQRPVCQWLRAQPIALLRGPGNLYLVASSGTKLGHRKNALEGDIVNLDPSSPSFLLAYQEMSRPPSQQTPYLLWYTKLSLAQSKRAKWYELKHLKNKWKNNHFP